jgi:hypothetical protein
MSYPFGMGVDYPFPVPVIGGERCLIATSWGWAILPSDVSELQKLNLTTQVADPDFTSPTKLSHEIGGTAWIRKEAVRKVNKHRKKWDLPPIDVQRMHLPFFNVSPSLRREITELTKCGLRASNKLVYRTSTSLELDFCRKCCG